VAHICRPLFAATDEQSALVAEILYLLRAPAGVVLGYGDTAQADIAGGLDKALRGEQAVQRAKDGVGMQVDDGSLRGSIGPFPTVR